MQTITDIAELESLYDTVVPGAITKVTPVITPLYRRWIESSRFMILATVGPEGTDASPRGDSGAVVHLADERTIWLPDWRGNNRLDSLRNIVRDGRISLLFMVPGSNNVVRVNGTAVLTPEATITHHFSQNGKHPRSVIVTTVQEAYFQCAKALMRSKLWASDDESKRVPSAGEFIRELQPDFDSRSYDDGYADYAKDRMW